MSNAVASTIDGIGRSLDTLIWFATQSPYATGRFDPEACDFCFGNPHEMPLPEIAEALTRWAVPRAETWFEYKMSEPQTVAAVAESLRGHLGIDFDPADISMTNGAFGGLAASLRAVVDPGDEVIYLSPPWFFYVPLILTLGGVAVRVDLTTPSFELPLAAIEAAVTDRTRAILVNTPHNPSGRILQAAELAGLAEILERASQRYGRPLYVISDEAYRRIRFDGAEFHTPLAYYDRSILVYTYGKTLLAPGQRLGYIALPPAMPDREELRNALIAAQCVTGWAFPNAVMQYALADLEKACIDIGALQRRRDLVVGKLNAMGYETVTPAGTFYVLVRSPLADDGAFARLLAADKVYVLPGSVFELSGWFRISLTASDAMVERSLPVFERALGAAAGG